MPIFSFTLPINNGKLYTPFFLYEINDIIFYSNTVTQIITKLPKLYKVALMENLIFYKKRSQILKANHYQKFFKTL